MLKRAKEDPYGPFGALESSVRSLRAAREALETHFEWLLKLGGFHDGLRKIIGEVFLDPKLLGRSSAVEILLRRLLEGL